MSVAWDATHDGRTVLRGSYNQYVDVDICRPRPPHRGRPGPAALRVERRTARPSTATAMFSGGAAGNTIGLPCGPTGVDANGPALPRSRWASPAPTSTPSAPSARWCQGLALSLDFVYRTFSNQYEIRETNRIWNGTGSSLDFTGGYRNGRAETIIDLRHARTGPARATGGVTLGAQQARGPAEDQGLVHPEPARGQRVRRHQQPLGRHPRRDVYL